MMKVNFLLRLLCFMACSLIPCVGEAEDEILWLRSNMPPFSIPNGPYAGKGSCDRVTAVLIEKMTGYENKVVVCNYNRILTAIKRQRNVGSAVLLKTPERENFIEFSIPYMVLLPNGILTLKSKLARIKPYLNEAGSLSLEKTITESKLKFGLSSGRKYSGIIDEILKKYEDHDNIYVNYKRSVLEPLLLLMLKGRIDYIPCYPNEAHYYAKQLGKTDRFVWFPVEGMPEYTLCYVGFPKNEWGRKIIDEINPILREHRNSPEFHEFYELWLDEVSIKRYRECVNDFYLNE